MTYADTPKEHTLGASDGHQLLALIASWGLGEQLQGLHPISVIEPCVAYIDEQGSLQMNRDTCLSISKIVGPVE